MPTAIDLFDKARRHERLEQLQAARDHDLMPYFRVLEGPAGPVVEMEGRRRIMLGSNNYLGLTRDPRVKQAAHDALDRYGTALTGSRFLNGTIPLHLELERELADWMGTEDALVFTTGYQANVGAIGTLLAPGDTVVADSGDHASILDTEQLRRPRAAGAEHARAVRLVDHQPRAVVLAQLDHARQVADVALHRVDAVHDHQHAAAVAGRAIEHALELVEPAVAERAQLRP